MTEEPMSEPVGSLRPFILSHTPVKRAAMFAEPSAKTQDLLTRMNAFFDEHIYPNEATYHAELDALRRRRRGNRPHL